MIEQQKHSVKMAIRVNTTVRCIPASRVAPTPKLGSDFMSRSPLHPLGYNVKGLSELAGNDQWLAKESRLPIRSLGDALTFYQRQGHARPSPIRFASAEHHF